MAFDDLRERLKEQLQATAAKIQESSAWNQLMEKYQDLPPTGQKVALFGASFVVALMLFMIPYSFYSSSETQIEDFEARKDLIRELYRVTRDVSALPPAPRAIDVGELRSSIQAAAASVRLQPEQNGPVVEFNNITEKPGFVPKGLTQNGVSVTFTKLNLDQLVNIGTRLQAMPTVKMTGLKVQATPEDNHYFNVTYKLVAFNLPPEPAPKTPGRPGSRPGGGQ